LFDPRRERHTFEESRKEFGEGQSYSSKAQPEVRECEMSPTFDQSAIARQGKEVSKLMDFLYTCINLIKDEKVVQELQHLVRQYEIGRIDRMLSRDVNQVSRKIRTNKELHLSAQIGYYDVDYVVLDLGSEVNVMTKKTWELMGKPRLIYSPIRLRMANQQAVSPFGRLEHVPVDVDGVRTFANFEVIEIVDDSCPYHVLLGIDWAFNNSTVVDLKKRRMTFEGNVLKVITPLDPDEGCRYTEPIREEDHVYELENIYKMTVRQHDYINPTTDGNLSWRSESACSSDSKEALENWQKRMYEVSTRRCARLIRAVRWIDTEVSNLPTFDGLNHLETFLAEFEKIVLVQQRMLALDDALKATPARWWGTHKKNITEWVQCRTLLTVHFLDQVEGCKVHYTSQSCPKDHM
jgi:hypothetical protein